MSELSAEPLPGPTRRPPYRLFVVFAVVLAVIVAGAWFVRTRAANAAEEAARIALEAEGVLVVKTDGHVQGVNSIRPIDDAVFANISNFGHLTTCSLAGAQTTDAQLGMIQDLPSLLALEIGGNKGVTSAGMAHVARIGTLERLFANGTSIDDAGLANLAGLSRLTTLDISDTQITDAGLKHLVEIPKLEVLRLCNDAVSDSGIESLKQMTSLKLLNIGGTKITPEGLKALRAARPELAVEQQQEVAR